MSTRVNILVKAYGIVRLGILRQIRLVVYELEKLYIEYQMVTDPDRTKNNDTS